MAMKEAKGISERRACGLAGIERSVMRYAPAPDGNVELRAKIIDLAAERRRFGYRRIHALVRREGIQVNHKRIYRLYRQAGLGVDQRRRKKRVYREREPLVLPRAPNEVWSMDFVMDSFSNARRIKCLTIVDDFTKQSVDIVADRSITGHYVTRVLDRIGQFWGLPKAIRTDQGPEFTSKALDQWAYRNGVQLKLIQPGKPTQNAYIESFNGKFRDECLNDHWFSTLAEARALIAAWRQDYNEGRPHSALDYLTPAEFATRYRAASPATEKQKGDF